MKASRFMLMHSWSGIVRPLCSLAIAFAGTATVYPTTEQLVASTGSAQCLQCHKQIYANWQQSDHHKAMQPAGKATVLGDFNDVVVSFHGIDTRLFESDGIYQVATVGKDGEFGVYTV